jgi:cell shape-determining protein MreC
MIILNYFNNFYAEFSLSKKIFLFKDVNNENIDFNKKILKIQQLISLTNQFSTDKNDAEEYQDLKEEKKE